MVKRIVILTGANRGLGRTTAELCLQKSKNHDELREQLKKINPNAEFELKDLEISDKQSRADFKSWVQQKYHKIDVLFNNAGVYDKADDGKSLSRQIAEQTFEVNFFSTVELTEELLPLLSDDGRIIEITSILGKFECLPESAKKYLEDDTLTKEKLYQLARSYFDDIGKKDLAFGNLFYYSSKAFLMAYVRYVASKYIKPNQSVFAVHPGWVQTDMGGPNAPMTKDVACVHLADLIGEFKFGRHPLSGKHIFENKDFGF